MEYAFEIFEKGSLRQGQIRRKPWSVYLGETLWIQERPEAIPL